MSTTSAVWSNHVVVPGDDMTVVVEGKMRRAGPNGDPPIRIIDRRYYRT